MSVLIARVTRELGHFKVTYLFFYHYFGSEKFLLNSRIEYALKVQTKFEVNQLSRS
jgi:hypothetical protein